MTLIRAIWDRYEQLMERVLKLEPLSPTSMLRFRTIVYRGEPLVAGDQSLLPGMRVLDVHLANAHAVSLGTTMAEVTFRLHERLRQDLLPLHEALQAANPPVEGVVGISVLARGARSLGFHLAPMPGSLWRTWLLFYMGLLDRVYRPAGQAQRRKKAPRPVQIMWLTKTEVARLIAEQVEMQPHEGAAAGAAR